MVVIKFKVSSTSLLYQWSQSLSAGASYQLPSLSTLVAVTTPDHSGAGPAHGTHGAAHRHYQQQSQCVSASVKLCRERWLAEWVVQAEV